MSQPAFAPASGPATGAQQQTGEQSQEQDPGCFYLTVKLGWDFVQPRIVGTLKPQLLVVFVAILLTPVSLIPRSPAIRN